MDEPELYEITVICRKCGGQESTYWTSPGNQYAHGCSACSPGTTNRVPMRRKK